ncbi:hypothetical protein [Nesterenkonia sp. PF2B19]|uniref:hypothetical protein n=1 Tax=Nesterenkonia sp. PF2B19 TaxID=1881858 RepID=UPI000A6F5002|nr:hypothetical protein [Nesterenkonia sp. PF2B19]
MTGPERTDEPSEASKPVRTPRAGRDLPAAIITGAALLIPAVLGIMFFPLLLIMVAVVLLSMGVWEVARAWRRRGCGCPRCRCSWVRPPCRCPPTSAGWRRSPWH